MFHEAEMKRKEAQALKGEPEPEMPSIFKSNELGQFGPQVGEMLEGVRSQHEM